MEFKKPTIKTKVIADTRIPKFEQKMDKFLEPLDSYSVQFKPVCNSKGSTLVALIMYQEPETSDEES